MRYFLPSPSIEMAKSEDISRHDQITSANVRSILRKYQMPLPQSAAVMVREIINAEKSSGDCPRSNAQRNPSITPTIGFNEYKWNRASPSFSFTIELLKPTGEMKTPNWTMNGIT